MAYNYPSRPRIRFEAISEAFEMFKAEMATWILASLITMGLTFACLLPFYGYMLTIMWQKRGPDFGQIVQMYGFLFTVGILAQIVQGICRAGMHNMAWRQLQGEKISLRDLFSIGPQMPSVAIASLLMALAICVGAIFCYLPGLIVSGLFMFALPIIVRKRVGPVEGMAQSWDMLKGDLWMATGFSFVVQLLAGAGGIVCGVGILFTLPFWPLATTIVYRDFVGDDL